MKFCVAEVFADSSFFNDSKHSYPTVEEQIKMARKVAHSLTAAINQDTRGHQMFMKRKEKLGSEEAEDRVTWPIGDPSHLQHDNHFNSPSPWTSNQPFSPSLDGNDSSALPFSSKLYSAARLIPTASDDNSIKAMSADEFERVRLFDKKSAHDTMAPQVCFSLADDLRNSNSKGGRMFAKRRAKADQWTVENQPKPETMDKICTQYANNQKHKIPVASSQQNDTSSFVIPKLQTELPRPRITPWDAVAEYGNIEPAFQHLSDISFITTYDTSSSG
jgi:hypothetical protein